MIPDYLTTMLPILNLMSDEKIRAAKDIQESMIDHFEITAEEQKLTIPSGPQPLFYNRVAWALSHLKRAEILHSPERGKYQIDSLGKEILKNPPDKFTTKYIKSLQKNNKALISNELVLVDDEDEIDKTPDELIELGFSQLNTALSNILITQIKNASPYYFERIVLDLLLKMGYGGAANEESELTSKSGDEGIDGIIKEDLLGLDKIYIQAKKWENVIGRPEIQKFVGALQGKRARKGVFITTSYFSKEAIEYSKVLDVSIVLIDGDKLTKLMIENNLGATVEKIYYKRKLDTDYFIEE